jgi:hypothetical protein
MDWINLAQDRDQWRVVRRTQLRVVKILLKLFK